MAGDQAGVVGGQEGAEVVDLGGATVGEFPLVLLSRYQGLEQ